MSGTQIPMEIVEICESWGNCCGLCQYVCLGHPVEDCSIIIENCKILKLCIHVVGTLHILLIVKIMRDLSKNCEIFLKC